jgi:capsular polysaccharide transport system ATP-binding protein
MIEIEDVCKTYDTHAGRIRVLNNINLCLKPGEHVGVLGRNGAGKSTLIRLISGAEQPTSGVITRSMSVSWPLAFGGAFQNALTGLDNYRFICRIYGADPEEKMGFIEDFAELGLYLREPVRTYSAGMRARLAFAISMAVEFDCFLVDEIVAVGDVRFHEKCHRELFERRGHRSMILVSHEPSFIREHCHRAAVLKKGRMYGFDNVEAAYAFYMEDMAT